MLDTINKMDVKFISPPSAPVFDPSIDEFKDPLAYIRQISPIASNYGICKIRPPKGWRPSFAVDSYKFSFTPRIQDLSDVCGHNRVRSNFITSLINFWETQEVTIFAPQIKGMNFELFLLWKYIKHAGGFEAVCQKKLWCMICEKLGLLSSPAFASALCSHYKNVLLPYDLFLERYNIDSQNSKNDLYSANGTKRLSIDKVVCTVCGVGDDDSSLLLCDECDTLGACHTYCLSPPLSDVPKGKWFCYMCVARRYTKINHFETFGFKASPRKYTLDKFSIRADEFKMKHFGKPCHMVSLEEGETEFWRLMDSNDTNVCVEYGADLNARDHGSGFPVRKSSRCNEKGHIYSVSPWNLNNISVLEDSALRFLPNDISGMIVPWCYVGMVFSCFCWHTEDHWSYSINYLHTGEAKTWYGVPTNSAEAFEAAMRLEVPELFAHSSDLLHHMTTMISPAKLREHGVPVYRLDQMPGEFIVTFPRAFHAGFNQGFNFAEAVNFCPADWFDHGQYCIEYYALLHRTPVFSHAELLCCMAQSTDPLSIYFLTVVTKQLNDTLNTERSLRRHLARIGVRRTERMAFGDDSRECELCRTLLYLSSVGCKCSTSMHCLAHYQARSCCTREEQFLCYRFDLDELTQFRDRLQTQLDDYERWRGQVESKVFVSMSELDSSVKIPISDDDNNLRGDDEAVGLNVGKRDDNSDSNGIESTEVDNEANLDDTIAEVKKEEKTDKLTLEEMQDLLLIGKTRNYPTASVRRLGEIVQTITECSEVIAKLVQNYESVWNKSRKFHSLFIKKDESHKFYWNRLDDDQQQHDDMADKEASSNSDSELQSSSSELDESAELELANGRPNGFGRKSNRTLKGPTISKLTLPELTEVIKLAAHLPVAIPQLDRIEQFTLELNEWRTCVNQMLDRFNSMNANPVDDLTRGIDSKKTYSDMRHLFNIPSVGILDQLIAFSGAIYVELPELRRLQRLHECLNWIEQIEEMLTFKQPNTESTVDDKPCLIRLCDLKLQGDQLSATVAYVGSSGDVTSSKTILDFVLEWQTKRLIETICMAKAVEDKLNRIVSAKPHSLSIEVIENDLTEAQSLPIHLSVTRHVRDVIDTYYEYNDKFVQLEQCFNAADGVIDKSLVESLGLGTVNSTPPMWKSSFDSIVDEIKDCVVKFDKIEVVRDKLSTIVDLHEKLCQLFVPPGRNCQALLELLLPRSKNALEWLIRLDGGELSTSLLNEHDQIHQETLAKRHIRSPTHQASTYKAMCKENARDFAKISSPDRFITHPDEYTDSRQLYHDLYVQFIDSEIALIQFLRNTNVKKSRAKNQDKVVYCICRQVGFSGFMLQCELCRDWVHGRCVTLPTLKESETERLRYICPHCESSRRPELNALVNFLVEVNATDSTQGSAVAQSTNFPIGLCPSKKLYRFPEFVAAYLLYERAFLFIQRLRNVLASNSELNQALAEYERFFDTKMPLDHVDIDLTLNKSQLDDGNGKKVHQPNISPNQIDLPPPPQQQQQQQQQQMKVRGGSTYHRGWPPGRLYHGYHQNLPSVKSVRSSGASDSISSSQSKSFVQSMSAGSMRGRKPHQFGYSKPPMMSTLSSGIGKEAEAAEALTDFSNALGMVQSSFGFDMNSGPTKELPFHSRPGLARDRPSHNPPNCLPSRPNASSKLGPPPPTDNIDHHHHHHQGQSIQASRKFYYSLSTESRTILELLIMEACLLEVTIPQTRWLWQLHLASDREITSGGGRRPAFVKMEEDRLKRRILRFAQQMKPVYLSKRIRAGRKKRRPFDVESNAADDDNDDGGRQAGDDDDDVDDGRQDVQQPLTSPIHDGYKRRRMSASRTHSNESDQSSVVSTGNNKPAIRGMHGVKRKLYRVRGRTSDLSIARRYQKTSRPRRFPSLRGRYSNQRLFYASPRIKASRRLDSSANCRSTDLKSRLTTKSDWVVSGGGGSGGGGRGRIDDKRMRNMSGDTSTSSSRGVGDALRRKRFVRDNDYISGSDEELFKHKPTNYMPIMRGSFKTRSHRGCRGSTMPMMNRRGGFLAKFKRHVETDGESSVAADDDGDDDDDEDEMCQAKPCLNPSSGTVEWIACDGCGHWFHQYCVGIHCKSQVPELYLCLRCRRRSIKQSALHSAKPLGRAGSSTAVTAIRRANHRKLLKHPVHGHAHHHHHPIRFGQSRKPSGRLPMIRKQLVSHNLLPSAYDDGTDDRPMRYQSDLMAIDRQRFGKEQPTSCWTDISPNSEVDDVETHNYARPHLSNEAMLPVATEVEVMQPEANPTEVLLQALEVVSAETSNNNNLNVF